MLENTSVIVTEFLLKMTVVFVVLFVALESSWIEGEGGNQNW